MSLDRLRKLEIGQRNGSHWYCSNVQLAVPRSQRSGNRLIALRVKVGRQLKHSLAIVFLCENGLVWPLKQQVQIVNADIRDSHRMADFTPTVYHVNWRIAIAIQSFYMTV